LILQADFPVCDPVLQSFKRVSVENVSLLGAPLFAGSALDAAWSDRCSDLSRAVERLSCIGSQDALILLRSSFGAPRVQHLLRCSPSYEHPALQTFDDLLKSALQRITNSDLSVIQWLQASLPIKDGGLGVRRVSSLALSAFLASAASTQSLQARITDGCHVSEDTVFQSLLHIWSSLFDTPPIPLPSKQSFWDRPVVLADKAVVQSSLSSSSQRASFLAAEAPHSGDWLYTLPIASCGLKLEDEAVRVAVALRLALDVCVPHSCRCGALVDAKGLHSFVCKRCPGRTVRHHALNDVVARAFTSANIPVTKEPNGLSRLDGKRPDGLTLIPWQRGKPLTWDVTVVSTLAGSYVSDSERLAGAAAELAATRKSDKYANLTPSYLFQPIAIENLGAMNDSCYDFFRELGQRITLVSGDVFESRYLFQRLSILIQRFNSVLLHESFSLELPPE